MHGIPCTFDAFLTHASRPIARCFIWPNELRSFHCTILRSTFIRYIRLYVISWRQSTYYSPINPKSESVSIFRTNLLQITLDSKRNFRFFKLCSRNSNITAFRIFLSDSIVTLYSISAPRKIMPTSLSSSFSTKNHLEILEFYIPKWSFLTRLSPVRSVACEFRARLWKQRHLGSGTGCILNRIQFIDVDGALTCSCHVLGSEAASSSVHSVECTSLARVSNILHALLPLHSRNNFCRARVLPVSFRTRNARN